MVGRWSSGHEALGLNPSTAKVKEEEGEEEGATAGERRVREEGEGKRSRGGGGGKGEERPLSWKMAVQPLSEVTLGPGMGILRWP